MQFCEICLTFKVRDVSENVFFFPRAPKHLPTFFFPLFRLKPEAWIYTQWKTFLKSSGLGCSVKTANSKRKHIQHVKVEYFRGQMWTRVSSNTTRWFWAWGTETQGPVSITETEIVDWAHTCSHKLGTKNTQTYSSNTPRHRNQAQLKCNWHFIGDTCLAVLVVCGWDIMPESGGLCMLCVYAHAPYLLAG